MPSHSNQSSYGKSAQTPRTPGIDITFEPGEFRPITPYSEDLMGEYEEAQHALKALRQKEEIIRRKAEQLEEITQKESAFTQSRSEIIDLIKEYLDLLDREATDARHIAAQCTNAQQRFHHHLKTLQNLRPEAADRNDLKLALDQAIRHIQAAKNDVTEAQPLIDHLSRKRGPKASLREEETDSAMAFPRDFHFWLKAGFAFTLPLMMLIIVFTMATIYLK